MPERFLEAKPADPTSAMPTRIEAPLPKRKLLAPNGSVSQANSVREGPSVSAGTTVIKSEERADSRPSGQHASNFEEWIASGQTNVKQETAGKEVAADARENSEELQPTSVVEEDKAPRRAPEFEFGAPVKKNPPSSTGSKPDWAGFPGARS